MKRFLVCALLLLCCSSVSARAALDLDGDGMPDVWVLRFEAAGLLPNGDADGDGLSNAVEAAAGTDPWKPGSMVKITAIALDGAGLHLSFPTVLGKRYQIQHSATADGPQWLNVGAALAGNGGSSTGTVSAAGNERFFRVLVLDIDSDKDGVTDWEELALGFDPNNSHSDGVSGPDDLTAVQQGLGAPSTITISASHEALTEPSGNPGSEEVAAFVLRRSGGFAPLTVNLATSGSATAGADFVALPTTVTFPLAGRTVQVPVNLLPDPEIESPEAVIATIAAGHGYVVGLPPTAAMIINDQVQANGTGLVAEFFNEASSGGTAPSTTRAPLMTNRVLLRDGLDGRPAPDATVNNDYLVTPWPGAQVNATYFASRWTGEVLPEFSQIYTFYTDVNSGGRLWVNGQLLTNNWPRPNYTVSSAEYNGTIELQGGVRYSLVFEHYETTGNNARAKLSWSSGNQPKQIIPQSRLFANRPPLILSSTEVLLLKDSGPYTYQIVASGNPTSYAATNLPPGWTLNSTTGLISGSPDQEGSWSIPLTATNGQRSGSAILKLQVIATGGGITREVWNGVPGTAVSDIPLLTNPSSTALLSSLEAPQDTGDNYGSRIRGYVTAPSTGIYKFWISADHAAELWISNDEEPVNAFKRAELLGPTAYRGWSDAAVGKSPLLWLEAGRAYYVEVRHKEAAGADHLSVGWIKPGEGGPDPMNAPAPSEVVPGYALSPYTPPAPVSGESTLFTTNLTMQGGAITSGFGTSSIRLSADERRAILRFTYANLSTPVVAKHIHTDAWNGHPQGEIIFDIDDATPQPDGSFVWDLGPSGTYASAAEIVNAIKAGVAYINIHTVNYPNGEIRGNYRLQAGSTTFTPPPPPPAAWPGPNDQTNPNAAARFLIQSTFGVSGHDANANLIPDAIEQVQTLGYNGWIEQQFTLGPTNAYPWVFTNRTQTDPNGNTYTGSLMFNSWWRNSITAPDQLRQRVAFALSEILVISEAGPLDNRSDTISKYYDTLLEHSFGNFRELLQAVTLHPAMGRYLDMLRNDKPNKSTGQIPNENYAREILQLFSIGLNRLWPDGSLMLNSKGEPIATYDQNAVIGFSHVFTGWDYFYTGANRTSFGASSNWINPMRAVPVRHFTGQKRLLNNEVLPGLPFLSNGQAIDPYATHGSAIYNDPWYQDLPVQDLAAAHDAIFNHPNIGPFICRQLIQRLVTSTPSRGYLYRVVQKFNDNGSGVRGDLKAVIKAILLDYEARSSDSIAHQGFGKQREPLARVTAAARAFPAPAPVTGTYSQGRNGDALNLIRVITSTPHLYSNNHAAYLDFEGGTTGNPDDAPYTVTMVGPNEFTVRPLTSENATYSQAGQLITVTISGGHTYNAANTVYIDFTSGSPSSPEDGTYTVVSKTSDNLQFTARPISAKSGNYTQTGNIVTFTASTPHGFSSGSSIHLDFVSGAPGTPVSGVFMITTVSSDGLQFSVSYPADAVARSGSAFAALASEVATRSGAATTTKPGYAADRAGSVFVNYSDWGIGDTDTDLNQTPMKAPTVFNFFLPDYQFPGELAGAGLVTPEFELTSETTVIRQANFLYNGIFNDALGQSGLASFRSGARDIFIDLRPWMGNNPANNLPWTNDRNNSSNTATAAQIENLSLLIDRLNTLLMAGQFSPQAKAVLLGYLTASTTTTSTRTYTNITYSNASPSNTHKRDRVRAIVHLMITSPDFTIQK